MWLPLKMIMEWKWREHGNRENQFIPFFFYAIAANHRVISRHFLQPRVSGIAFLSTALIFFLAVASAHFVRSHSQACFRKMQTNYYENISFVSLFAIGRSSL